MKQYWAILSRDDKVSAPPGVNNVVLAPQIICKPYQSQQATQSTRHPTINPRTNPPRSCTYKFGTSVNYILMISDGFLFVRAATSNT